MADQDDIQIKLGISLQGVEASQTKAREVQQRTEIVKREATAADAMVTKVERKLEHFGLHGMKMAAKAAVIGSLAIAIDEFIPHEEESAWSAISHVAGSAIAGGLYGAMTGNPAAAGAGAVVGGIIAAIEEIKHSIEASDKKIDEIAKKEQEKDQAFRREQDEVAKQIQDIRRNMEIDEYRMQYQRYLELKSVLGGQ